MLRLIIISCHEVSPHNFDCIIGGIPFWFSVSCSVRITSMYTIDCNEIKGGIVAGVLLLHYSLRHLVQFSFFWLKVTCFFFQSFRIIGRHFNSSPLFKTLAYSTHKTHSAVWQLCLAIWSISDFVDISIAVWHARVEITISSVSDLHIFW